MALIKAKFNGKLIRITLNPYKQTWIDRDCYPDGKYTDKITQDNIGMSFNIVNDLNQSNLINENVYLKSENPDE